MHYALCTMHYALFLLFRARFFDCFGDFRGKAGDLRFGNRADGEADAFFEGDEENAIAFLQEIADGFRAFHRKSDEETGNVGHVFKAAYVGFTHENGGAFLDEFEIFRAFGVELFEFFRIFANGCHRFHRGAVAIRPAGAAAVLIDVHEFLCDAFVLRDADECAHALPVERETFGKGVGNQHKNIFRQVFKFLEETATRLLFSAVIKIRDIGDENDIFVFSFHDFCTEIGDGAPFVIGHAITGRVIGDAVQNDDGIVLFRDHIGNIFFEAFEIEMSVFGEEREGTRLAAGVDHDAVVRAPMPIGHEDFITRGGIIVHGMV